MSSSTSRKETFDPPVSVPVLVSVIVYGDGENVDVSALGVEI